MTSSDSAQQIIMDILSGFAKAKTEPFKGHPFKNLLRRRLPESLTRLTNLEDRYVAKGSAGLTQWTSVPWTALLDRLVTNSPQRGFYPTLLFKADMSGLYLTLNQGVTDVREEYRTNSAQVLRVRAADFLARLGKPPEGFKAGAIALGAPPGSGPALYDSGNIIAKFYALEAIPSDETLHHDLREIITAYQILVDGFDAEDDEISPLALDEVTDYQLYEERRKWRMHRRVERNATLARAAKNALGYKCQACDFKFEDKYGTIGEDFIEAHHLVPLSELKDRIRLNPRTDFAVLCANCHRMIHRLEPSITIEEFRLRIIKKGF